MRPSEKFESKAAGQKGSEAWPSHVENIFGRQRRHRALQPDAIERVIWICSTNVEIALQIHSILTNKPNFMRFSPENDDLTKNKPNLSQNKPNSNPISRKAKIDAKCVFTKDYEDICEYGQKKQTQFKPNQSQCRQRFQHRPL